MSRSGLPTWMNRVVGASETKEEAIAKLSERIHDKHEIGNGQWVYMHTKAARCRTRAEFLALYETIADIARNFNCAECSEHAQAYLRDHPFDPYFRFVDKDGEVGRGGFRYLWEFHNTVNARIGKPRCRWSVAKAAYYGSSCASCQVQDTPRVETKSSSTGVGAGAPAPRVSAGAGAGAPIHRTPITQPWAYQTQATYARASSPRTVYPPVSSQAVARRTPVRVR